MLNENIFQWFGLLVSYLNINSKLAIFACELFVKNISFMSRRKLVTSWYLAVNKIPI
jgi:hypothetical protein